jgi:asparagine synthase (glutamine-hydrolysing)
LKTALRGVIPDSVLDRPKQGFEPPLKAWFQVDLREMAHDILLSSRSLQRGHLTREGILGILKEHYSAQNDRSLHLWVLLILELWYRSFVDRQRLADSDPWFATEELCVQT